MDIPAGFSIISISSLGLFLWSGGEVLRGITLRGFFVLKSIKEQRFFAEQERGQWEQLCLPSPKDDCLSEGARDKFSLGHDGCPHALEHTAAVRGVTLAEEQIRAGSTNIAGTGERGQRELSFPWKWQHLLHPWEKQEKSGDRWAGLSASSPCCSWASQAPVLSTSHRSVLQCQQFHLEQGGITTGSRAESPCCTQSTAHARGKPSWCCLQIRIPNAKSYIRQLQK